MSDINKEAFKLAEQQMLEKKVEEVKGFILSTLEKIEFKKKEKEKVEEELRILKLDLEDLRNGKFDKIEERREKSKVARNVSVVVKIAPVMVGGFVSNGYFSYPTVTFNSDYWNINTAGTYTVSSGNSYYF